jgi:hypothetical protein
MPFGGAVHPFSLKGTQLCCAALACFWLGGCAFNVISIRQVPAEFQAVPDSTVAWTLDTAVKLRLKEGYASELKKGTTWRQVGKIAQGGVFHTADQVVTVEASHQHEADLVVEGNRAVGFYLRVEHSFTPADPPVEIKTTPR